MAEPTLPPGLDELCRRPAPCFVATLMPDGSPQLTQTWVDSDGEHLLINTVQTHQKVRNLRRDPRITLNVCDPDNVSSYWMVRGRVLSMTTEGAAEHIDALAQRYLGRPYPWFGGRDQVRLLVTIGVERAATPRG